jgi:hypothetical protein
MTFVDSSLASFIFVASALSNGLFVFYLHFGIYAVFHNQFKIEHIN